MYKKFGVNLVLMYKTILRPVSFAEGKSSFFLSSLSVLISNLPSMLYTLQESSFPSGKNMPYFTRFCDCFVTKAVIECAYDWKNL